MQQCVAIARALISDPAILLMDDLCVETTARDAADRGFHCVMVDDGCATGSQELHDASLCVFQRMLGRVETADAVVGELAVRWKITSVETAVFRVPYRRPVVWGLHGRLDAAEEGS